MLFSLPRILTVLLSFSLFFLQAQGHTMDQKAKNPIVLMKTSMGDLKIVLYQDKAPDSVANFLQYVKDGHYKGTIFHRVIPNFMIQGGGFAKDMKQKTTRSPIKNEADNGLKNEKGTLAMARTSDVNSATAQFFINGVDNSFLDFKDKSPRGYGYAVFGKVIDGMPVVDKIIAVKTNVQAGHENVPAQPIEILDVTVQ